MKKKEAKVAAKKAKKVVKKSAPVKKAKKVVKTKTKAKAKPAIKAKTSAKTVKKSTAKKAAPKAKATPKKVTAKKATLVKKSNPPIVAKATKSAASLQNFMTPLDDRILVRLAGAEKMTTGGLYIPDTVSDVSGNLEGQVVSVGRGHLNKKGHVRPMDVKLGDKVVFAQYAGSKIKIQNEDLIILRESDVMGVVAK